MDKIQFWLTDSLLLKDYVTLLNAGLGVCSIYFTIMQSFVIAGILIFLAVIADYADGLLARKTNTKNKLGKELDSLSDIVSFGVAPAILSLYLNSSLLTLICSVVFVCAGIVRLAKFNLQKVKGTYIGLPIPIAAIILSIINLVLPPIIPGSLIVLSVIMVSGVQFRKIGV